LRDSWDDEFDVNPQGTSYEKGRVIHGPQVTTDLKGNEYIAGPHISVEGTTFDRRKDGARIQAWQDRQEQRNPMSQPPEQYIDTHFNENKRIFDHHYNSAGDLSVDSRLWYDDQAREVHDAAMRLSESPEGKAKEAEAQQRELERRKKQDDEYMKYKGGNSPNRNVPYVRKADGLGGTTHFKYAEHVDWEKARRGEASGRRKRKGENGEKGVWETWVPGSKGYGAIDMMGRWEQEDSHPRQTAASNKLRSVTTWWNTRTLDHQHPVGTGFAT